MTADIALIANAPVSIQGRDGQQLADDSDVYTWDAAQAEYGPQTALERLVTHQVSAGTYELVYHSDGSVVWH